MGQVTPQTYYRIVTYIPSALWDGLMAVSRRDSRDVDHIIETALKEYVNGRKL